MYLSTKLQEYLKMDLLLILRFAADCWLQSSICPTICNFKTYFNRSGCCFVVYGTQRSTQILVSTALGTHGPYPRGV